MTSFTSLALITIALNSIGCKTPDSASTAQETRSTDDKTTTIPTPYVTCKGEGIEILVDKTDDAAEMIVKRPPAAEQKLKAEYIREDLSPPQSTISFAFIKPTEGGLSIECEGRGTDEGAAFRIDQSETIFLKCDFSKGPCGAP